MSEVAVDAIVIKRTQNALEKYVKKPVLSEKLLKKPPFRFLHDVFKAVIRNTGCFNGLYTAEELNVESIIDREAKMKFLQKMVDVIKMTTNEDISIKTSKIVAGHEPEKTNELLQLMGKVIDSKLDWQTAVNKINNTTSKPAAKPTSKEKKSNEKPATRAGETKEKLKTKNVKASKEKPAKTLLPSDSNKNDEKKTKNKPLNETVKRTSPEKRTKKSSGITLSSTETSLEPQIQLQEIINTKVKEPKIEGAVIERSSIQERKVHEIKTEVSIASNRPSSKEATKADNKESPANRKSKEILFDADAEVKNEKEIRQLAESKRSSENIRRSSAEKHRSPKVDETGFKMDPESTETIQTVNEELPESQTSSVVQSHQDLSQNSEVRRESTFVRENSRDVPENVPRPRTSLRPPSGRPASSRPGAPRRRDKNVEIILQPNDQVKMSGISVRLETFTSELEDDGENLVIIEDPHMDESMLGTFRTNDSAPSEDALQQGHLVQQILETQKELVQGTTLEAEQMPEKDSGTRQSSARQINSLRDIIQNLTKSINPLGKLMDFIPEDIDAMQLELTMWRDTYNQASIELKKERSLTESVTEPMKNQLITIESTIKEYQEMINECRAKILQNSEKILRLFTTQ